ncbi:hypothetical protein M569_04888, partial [Genlisea aurea]
GKDVLVLSLTLLLLFGGLRSVSATPSPARIVHGFLSNAFTLLMKWSVSLKSTTKTALSGRPVMKFEGGYNVETVFDGSKLGIEPHSVEVLSDGDLLILDSANCNLYKISSSLSLYSRPRLVSGSADGYCGYVDGKPKNARMSHPKGLTVDDRGNIYVADTDNMAIRKISDTGVTTIAGGKRGRGSGGHVDGPSEDAKFSNDFDVVYLGSSCSLLVVDRSYKAIREIQLHFDDCAYQYRSNFPFGAVVLLAAGFFGYVLALLQHRIGSGASSQKDEETGVSSMTRYRMPSKKRPSLIPDEHDDHHPEKPEESFLQSCGRVASEIVGGYLPVLKNRRQRTDPSNHHHRWQPVQQESFVIPDGDEPPPPPPAEARTPTPKKTYAFMNKDSERMQQQLKQSRAFYSGWDGGGGEHPTAARRHQQHHHRYTSSPSWTYYEEEAATKEIVFGAVQEHGGGHVVIKPLDHGGYDQDHRSNNARSRFGYMH